MDLQIKAEETLMKLSFLDSPPNQKSLLKEDLGIDSLKLVQLIISLEEDFKFVFDESDLNPSNIKTVGDLYRLLKK